MVKKQPKLPSSVQIRYLSDFQSLLEHALKRFCYGQRQSLLAQVDHLERFMRSMNWFGGPTTAEYRRRGQEEDRTIKNKTG